MTRGIGYNGHLRGPVTLTPVANRLAMELLLNDLGLSRTGIEPRFHACETNAVPAEPPQNS